MTAPPRYATDRNDAAALFDLDAFATTPLVASPYPHLVVPRFLRPSALASINADFPRIDRGGSFPPSELAFGQTFARFLEALEGPELKSAFEAKFGIDLTDRPTMITVRGRSREKDGRIHNDSATKIITVLLYLNEDWPEDGGRLRLLRSRTSLDDYVAEVPPVGGTLLAFRVTDNSWHGHKPIVGERRVLQLNWVTSADVVRHEQARHRLSARVKKLAFWSRA